MHESSAVSPDMVRWQGKYEMKESYVVQYLIRR